MEWIQTCLFFYKGADGLRYHLEGFKCPSKSLPSVIVIEDDAGRIDKICEDLTVQIEDGGKEAEKEGKDSATSLCLEASHSPLPSSSATKLLCAPLPIANMEKDFNEKIRSLESICPTCKDRCGTFYLTVSLKSAAGKALWFDSLALRKKCSDKPGLSLKVTTKSDNVIGTLFQGSQNPFEKIGIDKVTIRNEVLNCTKAKSSTGSCGNQTDLAARWRSDAPEVVAFLIPLELDSNSRGRVLLKYLINIYQVISLQHLDSGTKPKMNGYLNSQRHIKNLSKRVQKI